MSLFERLKSIRKEDLIIEINNTGPDDPWDDKNDKEQTKNNKNTRKKGRRASTGSGTNFSNTSNQTGRFKQSKSAKDAAEIGSKETQSATAGMDTARDQFVRTDRIQKNKDSLENTLKQNTKQNTSDRKLDQLKQQEKINKQYDMGGGEVIGTPQDQTYKSPSKDKVKEIMNKSVVNQADTAKRAKRFRQSFGTPTGANTETGKPIYTPSYTVDAKGNKNLAPDIELPKSRTGGVPEPDKITGLSGYDRASKTLGDRESAKNVYIDPKTNKASPEGVKRYIEKARNMSQGSNANTKANRKAAENIAKFSKIEYTDKINQKYGGRRADLKGTSNMRKFFTNINQSKNTKSFKNFMGKAVNIVKKNKGKAAAVVGGLALLGVGASKLLGGKKSKSKAVAGTGISGSRLRDLPTATYMDSKTGKPIEYTYGASKEKNPYGRIGSLESSKKLAAGLKDKSLYLSKFTTPSKKA